MPKGTDRKQAAQYASDGEIEEFHDAHTYEEPVTGNATSSGLALTMTLGRTCAAVPGLAPAGCDCFCICLYAEARPLVADSRD